MTVTKTTKANITLIITTKLAYLKMSVRTVLLMEKDVLQFRNDVKFSFIEDVNLFARKLPPLCCVSGAVAMKNVNPITECKKYMDEIVHD